MTTRIGQTVYRVMWKAGIPYIHHGKIVESGKKRIKQYAEFNGVKYPLTPSVVSIMAAIEAEILECADECRLSWRPHYQPGKPWRLARCIAELTRLYARCRKRHLVPKRKERD